MGARSESVEVSARTVDEAIAEALKRLGVERDQVEIRVVRQGSRGLLGLLAEDAIVRVSVLRPQPVPEAQEVRVREPEAQPDQGDSAPPVESESDDASELATEVLQNLMDLMGLRAQVVPAAIERSIAYTSESLCLNVEGDGLGVLIGRRGETLRDLQYLTCLMVSRKLQRWPNLVVDVQHYKQRRERSLRDLAQRMADRVRESGQPVHLEPMPPNERRIVHLTLRDDPDVFTESYGQDERRKVVILPKG
jgi:spoIIIJ-associated protein